MTSDDSPTLSRLSSGLADNFQNRRYDKLQTNLLTSLSSPINVQQITNLAAQEVAQLPGDINVNSRKWFWRHPAGNSCFLQASLFGNIFLLDAFAGLTFQVCY
jgi:hypothetical protein